MPATVIGVSEGTPESYPASGLSPEPANATLCWQRIEAYISRRWTPRPVIFVVQGPGEFVPPLSPFDLDAEQVWTGDNFEPTPEPIKDTPMGLWLPERRVYHLAGVVGDTEEAPPSIVREAVKRLSGYLDACRHRPGIRSATAGSVNVDYDGSEMSTADAMRRSGAADLLRQYRRAA